MHDSPLLVFSDDWGRHPSSCQHLIRHLLPRHPVTWVNTIGTREPRFDLNTLYRAFGKIRQWFFSSSAQPASDNPQVVNPWMWPWFGSRFSRNLNRWLLCRTLVPLIKAMPAPPVVVTTIPLVADLVGELPVRRWAYYWVDDFTQWPGYDGETLRRMEGELVGKVDVLVAASEALRSRAREAGREAHLLTHGTDLAFWSRPMAHGTPAVALPPGDIFLFWGLIDRRMDLAFVRALAEAVAGKGSVVLTGPEDDPSPDLKLIPNVHFTGPVAFEHLPLLAARASVLIMPYADIPATQAMQPLKLKEYLATGKPVVVRDLPANWAWADCLDLANEPRWFSELALRRAAEGVPPEQSAARGRLAEEGWADKAKKFEGWITAEGGK
jgi:glycosyltransferase involved in cell wall biosynthesis